MVVYVYIFDEEFAEKETRKDRRTDKKVFLNVKASFIYPILPSLFLGKLFIKKVNIYRYLIANITQMLHFFFDFKA